MFVDFAEIIQHLWRIYTDWLSCIIDRNQTFRHRMVCDLCF